MNTSLKSDEFQEDNKSSNIYRVIIKLLDYDMGEFGIDDVIFNIPFA